ncbi:MAG TPA: translation elongation factor Ts [Oligoflexia bacterium]|nr:translation elongation factor Ts [Oligoflexia bacterium]HMP47265.1 translation elongation factor Ts [Oligoflexia bacterium]
MSQISAESVKTLRERTGAGMMDCKKALQECGGDMEQAQDYLRKKGLKMAEKRSGKVAAEGTVCTYLHPGGRIGVMLELNCETDFVARHEEFLALAKDIALHIAWANPRFVSREEIPEEVIEREKSVFAAQLKPEQEKVADKIIAGKLEKFFEEVCLLDQIDVRDSNAKKKIGYLLTELTAKMGEKVVCRRFTRFELGAGIEKENVDFAAEVAQVANG